MCLSACLFQVVDCLFSCECCFVCCLCVVVPGVKRGPPCNGSTAAAGLLCTAEPDEHAGHGIEVFYGHCQKGESFWFPFIYIGGFKNTGRTPDDLYLVIYYISVF